MPTTVIIKTGIANTASVAAAIERCNVDAEITDDPARVRDAARVVLPGVGSFAAGMAALRRCGLDGAVRDRVDRGRPLLAICLGMQLLCKSSEESPGETGLAIADADVVRLPAGVRVPQFGWNLVDDRAGAITPTGYAYFANSFRVPAPPAGWDAAMTTHGEPLVAAMRRGSVLACQFHPELSGPWGSALIARWIARAEAAAC